MPVSEIEELEANLLGGRRSRRPVDGLPGAVLYGLYAADGRAVVSPWPESPPLVVDDEAEGEGVVETPSGGAFFWWTTGSDGVEVLYLPMLRIRQSLERVGTHALAGFLPLLALILATAVPRTGLRRLGDTLLRSYSRRLLLVYALLLLIPLVALNLVLMRAFEKRLRDEQLVVAQDALDAARLFLVDFIQGIPTGFGIETQVNRELLEWIDGLVEHPVNIYWGGSVYASSQQELFAAGLLPRRVPGEIYSRLALLDYERGVRTQHRGEVDYREVYALLKIPGTPASMRRLFVSVPLLSQEVEVTRELAALRRRALLVTTALVVLVLGVGSRLVRSFTRPLMELVAGTRRIAGGANRLGVTPRDQELSALASAIDAMAGRIDEGRRRLLNEKQVVDRMVEHVTSGIVSLDRGGRVLLQNRVARELLGSEVGRPLGEALKRHAGLEPVREALRSAGPVLVRSTLRLSAPSRVEGSESAAAEEREWTVTWVPLPGPEDPAALVVVDDATEVLRGQRLEAWAEMARLIAHEIKNPLTPIKLSTEHMRQVWGDDPERFGPIFERCTTNVLRQVEELRSIASEFSTYSRIPQIRRESGDLVAALAEVVDAYQEAAAVRGVTIDLRSEVEAVEVPFDRRLLRRAIRNLVENALRASRDGGTVTVDLAPQADEIVIGVRDRGPGVPSENLHRIFEPYFSTHETGVGLGLAITRRVIEEHGGRIEARPRPGGGLEMIATLPSAPTEPRRTADS